MAIIRADLGDLYRKLYERLSIRQATAMLEDAGVQNQIQPVVNVGDEYWETFTAEVDTAVTNIGDQAGWTAPTGYRYEIRSVRFAKKTGTYTFNEYLFLAHSTLLAVVVASSSSAAYHILPEEDRTHPFAMLPGDALLCEIDAITVAGNVNTSVYGLRTKLY